jgi:hypothetical protein
VPELDTLHRSTNPEESSALTLEPGWTNLEEPSVPLLELDTLHQRIRALMEAADLRSRQAFPEAEMSQNKKPRQAQAAVSEKTAPQVLQARCAAWAHLRW